MAHRCLLYYITDRSQFRGDGPTRRRALLAKIAEAARAGVDYIQLREKDLSAQRIGNFGARQAWLCGARAREFDHRTRLLINSRTDVALAAGADGVHLRADDVAPHEVRQMLDVSARPPAGTANFLVAVSCHSNEDVIRAESEAADFAVFAPVFGKRDCPERNPPASPPCAKPAGRRSRSSLSAASPWKTPRRA